MNGSLYSRLFGAATILVSAPLLAEPSTQPSATAPVAVPESPIVATLRPTPGVDGAMVLPVNTDLLLTLNDELNSKNVKLGETFPLTVSTDVMLGNYVVIPRGTPATGEVTYRTGKGAFGKSAKMEIELRSIDLNGRHIPIRGHFREEGSGNTGATVGTAVAVGPFAVFVTGRSAIFRQNREFRAQTQEPLQIAMAN